MRKFLFFPSKKQWARKKFAGELSSSGVLRAGDDETNEKRKQIVIWEAKLEVKRDIHKLFDVRKYLTQVVLQKSRRFS